MLKKILISLTLMASIYMFPAGAASVSYFLDQSNTLPDSINYLQVTIDDEGSAGAINFTVETLSAFTEGENFGIQAFGFNGLSLTADNIAGLEDGWGFRSDKNLSEFGGFTNYVSGKGSNRLDPLTFSITEMSFDDIMSYVELSTGKNKNLSFFSAHVAGFTTSKQCLTSAWFGGSTPSPVPVPAAVWLFGSGLIGLIGVARRKR